MSESDISSSRQSNRTSSHSAGNRNVPVNYRNVLFQVFMAFRFYCGCSETHRSCLEKLNRCCCWKVQGRKVLILQRRGGETSLESFLPASRSGSSAGCDSHTETRISARNCGNIFNNTCIIIIIY